MKKKLLPKFFWLPNEFRKILLIMKLTVIVFLLSIIQLQASVSYGQSTLITLNMHNTKIEDVFKAIEKQSEFEFFYNDKQIDVSKAVTVNAKNITISDLLKSMLTTYDVTFSVIGKRIILVKQNSFESELLNTMSGKLQGTKITGKITSSSDHQGVPGVNVKEKGTSNGTISDLDGVYSITVSSPNAVLSFSFIGFESIEIPLEGKKELDVVLKEKFVELDQVVVVGYGSVKKSDLSGSVSSVKAEQLSSYPASGSVQALQGRAAGVQISANNGDPGGSMSVRVRGGTSINASSDPLYVVDGFVGGMLPQPEDIESLEVLKDASATAIYGSRGSNGVIMITTKKGMKGKARIEYNTSFSSQKEISRIEMLNGEQYAAMTKEVVPTYVSFGANTNWQDVIFRKGGVQNHQLSVSGGTDVVNYYVSGSYFDQKGIILGSAFNKYTLTSNINIKATDKLKIGLNLFGQRANTDGVSTQEASGGASEAGVVGSSLRFMPDQGIYLADGITYSNAAMGDPIDNPYTIIKENTNNIVGDRMQANFSGEYEIFTGLSLKSTLGFSTTNNRQGRYASSLTVSGRGKGIASINGTKNTNLASENYLSYNTTLATDHKIGVMAGYSYSQYRNENWFVGSNTFITDAFSNWNLGGGSVIAIPSSSMTDGKQASFYSRMNYGFSDKYIVTFTARYDGSSNFSKNNKWAFFPSGAIAWNMKNENFMKNISQLSQLKWRASYGITGNQAIGPYSTLAKLTNVYSIVNGAAVNAVRPLIGANDELKWESTKQLDIGADIGVFDNRINLTFDYYKMTTFDLLFDVPLPAYMGTSAAQTKNAGKIENKGIELTLSGKILTGEVKWNMDINLSANRNKVLELPDHKDILIKSGPGHIVALGNTQILREGQPVGSMYGYVYNGVYQVGDVFTPGPTEFEKVAGGEKYADINGTKDANGNLTGVPDGALSADDQTIIGNPTPKFFYGFNNEFKWKDLDLSIFIQGTQGNDILSFTLLELETLGAPINSTTEALNRWTPTNTNTNVPMRSASRSQKVSSRWVFDGSYMRVKNVVLGYNLSKPILKKVNIQKLRLYVSAQNILTFTKYRGFDPEVNYKGAGSSVNQGLDYASYPNAKSYTVGLNIIF